MNLIKLRQKSQITIPKDVIKKLGLSPGDYLGVDADENKIVLMPKVRFSRESELSKNGESIISESLEQLKNKEFTVHKDIDDLINNLS